MKDYPRLPLGSLVKIVRGISYKSSQLADGEVGVAMVNLRNVGKGGGFRTDGLKRYTGEYKPSQVLEPGDLILANTDLSKAKDVLGSTFLIPQTLSGAVLSLDLSKLVPDESVISKRFLNYYLHSPEARSFMKVHGQGITVMHLRMSALPSLEVPVPPLDEQKRIVEALDDHLSRLDKALAEIQSAIAKATTYWHSMLQSLLFSDESGNLASTVELGSLAELVMGQAPAGSDCNKNGVGTPFVKVGEFGASSPEIREWTTKPLKMAQSSDVLICVVGATIGKLNLGIDCAIGRSVAAIRPGLKLRQKYLFYFLQTKVLEIRASSKGSAQGVITRQQLLEMPIPDLSLASQDRVIQSLETARSSLDNALSDLNKVSSSISTLRRSVLNSAFTGELFTSGIETQ